MKLQPAVCALALLSWLHLLPLQVAAQEQPAQVQVQVQVQGAGSAAGIEQPLAAPGDAARGRAIAANRQLGLCLLCHSAPMAQERFQGNLAPDLSGVGARYNHAQLRLRVVDSRRIHATSLMPPFHSTEQLSRVGQAWQGKPLLNAQQVEDVVAWLATLR